jgi:hypothetical protein
MAASSFVIAIEAIYVLFSLNAYSYKCYRVINSTTIIVATVIFVLVGTLVFAAIAPFMSEQNVDSKRPMTLPPCDDENRNNDKVCEARPGPGPRPR